MMATLYGAMTISWMREEEAGRTEEERNKRFEGRCRLALVLGPGFPTELVEFVSRVMFLKGVEVTCIRCDDPRAAAIQGGNYTKIPLGVLEAGGRAQPVYLLRPECAQEFDMIESVNYFDHGGGTITRISCALDELGRVLRNGIG